MWCHKVVDRSLDSVWEHYREVLWPKIEAGGLEPDLKVHLQEQSKYNLPTKHTPKTQSRDPKPTASRTSVTKKEIVIVAQYLAEFEGKVAPTSKAWWEKSTKHKVRLQCHNIHNTKMCMCFIYSLLQSLTHTRPVWFQLSETTLGTRLVLWDFL